MALSEDHRLLIERSGNGLVGLMMLVVTVDL
jgi:hypothetical protein